MDFKDKIKRSEFKDFQNNSDFGTYGIIFSNKYNSVITLPNNETFENIKGHEDSIRITAKVLYKEEMQFFYRMQEDLNKNTPKNLCFVDFSELKYALFLSSVGESIFLNSSDGRFLSGIITVPIDISLSSLDLLNTLEKVIRKIQEEVNIEVAIVPKYTEYKKYTVMSLGDFHNYLINTISQKESKNPVRK